MSNHDDHDALYLKVFIALAVLTCVTVGVAHIPMAAWLGIVAAFAIAATKGTLVALYFMHLKFEVKTIYIVVGVPLTLTIILILALMPDIGFVAG